MRWAWLGGVWMLRGLVLFGVCGVVFASEPSRLSSPGAHLLGNTLVFSERPVGALLSDTYLRADGSGWAFDPARDTQPAAIRWFHQSDGQFCITRALRGFPDPAECGVVTVSESRVAFQGAGGGVHLAELKADDPLGLEARATGRSPRRVVGADAASMLVGNTLLLTAIGGREPNGAIYLMPNGSFQLLTDYDSGGDHVGEVKVETHRWRMQPDGRLCLSFKGKEKCADLSIADHLVVLRDPEVWMVGMLEQGDVRHLSPQQMRESKRLQASITGATLAFASRYAAEGQRALYLGRDGTGDELERKAGRWVRKDRIYWMFRPDLRWLCTFTARRPRADIRYYTSNCTPLVFSAQGIAFKAEGKPPIPITVSKRRPNIVDP
jgi:hypothetical protein